MAGICLEVRSCESCVKVVRIWRAVTLLGRGEKLEVMFDIGSPSIGYVRCIYLGTA
jgi:hypothetical protein